MADQETKEQKKLRELCEAKDDIAVAIGRYLTLAVATPAGCSREAKFDAK